MCCPPSRPASRSPTAIDTARNTSPTGWCGPPQELAQAASRHLRALREELWMASRRMAGSAARWPVEVPSRQVRVAARLARPAR
jgi:hypothetical protein